jgi:hypothetical protein
VVKPACRGATSLPGLGEEQAALEGGEGDQSEVVGVGIRAELSAVAHRGQALADEALPAGESEHEEPSGLFVDFGEFAGQ